MHNLARVMLIAIGFTAIIAGFTGLGGVDPVTLIDAAGNFQPDGVAYVCLFIMIAAGFGVVTVGVIAD